MPNVFPTEYSLGCRIEGIDLSKPLNHYDETLILDAFGRFGVVCFPCQSLEPIQQKMFASRFGSLEVNVAAGHYTVPEHPEVMILSNEVVNGKQIGLGDAGQDWHTDMSYSKTVAFLNILYAVKVPSRDGQALGDTEFLDMCAAYESLPEEVKERIENLNATHDFDKFWSKMITMPGTQRKALTPEQRAAKPPVSHPMVLTHPISGKKALYCNTGYVVRIDNVSSKESDDLLTFLFSHQIEERFKYTHKWTEGDVLAWDNLWTMHNAKADYEKTEIRLMHRCQTMADKVLNNQF
jgi:taurine dioxygenase